MSTEDDTFLRLKRLTYGQLTDVIKTMPYDRWLALTNNDKSIEEFLNTYGWTLDDYFKMVGPGFVG